MTWLPVVPSYARSVALVAGLSSVIACGPEDHSGKSHYRSSGNVAIRVRGAEYRFEGGFQHSDDAGRSVRADFYDGLLRVDGVIGPSVADEQIRFDVMCDVSNPTRGHLEMACRAIVWDLDVDTFDEPSSDFPVNVVFDDLVAEESRSERELRGRFTITGVSPDASIDAQGSLDQRIVSFADRGGGGKVDDDDDIPCGFHGCSW